MNVEGHAALGLGRRLLLDMLPASTKDCRPPEPGALLRHIGDGAVQVSPAKKEVDARRLLALLMVSDAKCMVEIAGRTWKIMEE